MQQARLRAIYASGAAAEQLRADKARAFDELRADYEALKSKWQGNSEYDAWFAQPLNNATLASVATYTRWLPALRARLQEVGLAGFYSDAIAIADLDPDERAAQLLAWEVRASAAPATSAVR